MSRFIQSLFGGKLLKLMLGSILILFWTLGWGWSIASALEPTSFSETATIGTLDPVPERYQLGKQLYLDSCSSCHLAVSPAVFPTETWRQILQQPSEHYGVALPTLLRPKVILMWEYLRTFSRPIFEGETTPYRVAESRYFEALHPRVEFSERVNIRTCISCHPSANAFDYRTLTPEWEDAP